MDTAKMARRQDAEPEGGGTVLEEEIPGHTPLDRTDMHRLGKRQEVCGPGQHTEPRC